MLTDALLTLSSAQAVTASAVSSNAIDLSQNRDIGAGEDLYAIFSVDTAPTAAGAATVRFQVISASDAALTTGIEVLAQTDDIPITDLTVGMLPISLPIAPSVLHELGQRYLGVRYEVGTGPLTAGAFSALISDTEVTDNKNYPSGYAVG